jgi:hypothetical protein
VSISADEVLGADARSHRTGKADPDRSVRRIRDGETGFFAVAPAHESPKNPREAWSPWHGFFGFFRSEPGPPEAMGGTMTWLMRTPGPRALPILPPLAEVIGRAIGPPPGRRGEDGRRLWWPCPLHPDRNPSLTLTPEGKRWQWFGCGAKGNAIDFIRRLNPGMTFPEAVSGLTGGSAGMTRAPTRPTKRPAPKPAAEPSGLLAADALTLVEAAAGLLRTPEGSDALAYLTGPRRYLTPEEAARLIRAPERGWVILGMTGADHSRLMTRLLGPDFACPNWQACHPSGSTWLRTCRR